jgi:23S rRNA (pseudouridine1915-N3)-methyltransferase
MRITVLAVGRLKDGPERELTGRYLDRARALGRGLGVSGLDVVEVAESRAARPADRQAEEARELAARIGEADIVLLDERGSARDSDAFARDLARRRDAGTRQLVFVIGGADGLDAGLRERAAAVIGFGAMTLPHQLVRVLVAEQIYRAMTILAGHPYHRA